MACAPPTAAALPNPFLESALPLSRLFQAAALLPVLLLGCGDLGSTPTAFEAPICPDQPMADLNERLGDLANLLYRVDVNNMLLAKGASDRFHTTVAGHEPLYEKGEIADITLSIVHQSVIADSVRTLFAMIDSIGSREAPQSEWLDLFRRWERSVETSLTMSDSLESLIRDKAGSLLDSLIAVREFSPEKVAFECTMEGIGRGFPDIASFADQADEEEWLAFIPELVSCGLDPWRDRWYDLTQRLFLPGQAVGEPFLGQVGFFRLPELIGAETGWSEAERWGGGEGRIDVTISADPDSTLPGGACVAVLLPESGPRGSYYQTFFAHTPKPFVSVPSGTYEVLLFTSGGRPVSSGPIAIEESGTEAIHFIYRPINPEWCRGGGGGIDTWVLDPSDEAHLSIPCNCPCQTEVWQGETLFQSPLLTDTTTADINCTVRRSGSFNAIVSCRDRTISGTGTGKVTLIKRGGDCDYRLLSDSAYTFSVSGRKISFSAISLEFVFSSLALSAERTCPGGGREEFDLGTALNQDYRPYLSPDSFGRAEIYFPPGTTPESSFHLRTTLRRIF